MSPKRGWLSSWFRGGGDVGNPQDGVSPVGRPQGSDGASLGDWHLGQPLLDDFVVERVLGEGGMGKVYLLKSRTTGMRFAVKRAKGLSERDRRNFLAELQTWIDLPEHANLVPCLFFRTLGDEVLIFAEYVDGGSLKEWIDSGRLCEGEPQKALERILDIAIQFAWGLVCVHELGLVHQDVKPDNVMMGTDRKSAVRGVKPRVTDFGLARARAAAGQHVVTDPNHSILVSNGGGTPAYWSPEQANGRPLTLRTDIWSWGLSVLEMFTGGVTWHSGSAAAGALEVFLEHNGEEERVPAMPLELAEILQGCFRQDPGERWKNLSDIVRKLRGIYHNLMGVEYTGVLCEIEHMIAAEVGEGSRRTRQGYTWADPTKWLERALEADGRNKSEAAKILAPSAASRRGQLAADIAAFNSARAIYERLIYNGRKDLEDNLSVLCINAACVHETAGDFPGALALYDQVISYYQRLRRSGRKGEAIRQLAMLHDQKANVLTTSGDIRAALVSYDSAIEIYEHLVTNDKKCDSAAGLAGAYAGKATALENLGEGPDSLEFFDRGLKIFEQLVYAEGRKELANNLATLYMNKAIGLVRQGKNAMAIGLFDRAIEIRERLVNIEHHRDLAHSLAILYMNKAAALKGTGDTPAAIFLYEKAIKLSERLVNVDGRRDIANDLAALYVNHAIAFMELGNNRSALELYDRAIAIREHLVNTEGRHDLASNLATLYMNKANAFVGLGDSVAAAALYDRAIALLERMLEIHGSPELARDLAFVCMNKAYVMAEKLSDSPGAVVLYDRALQICEPLANAEGRHPLDFVLGRLYTGKAMAFLNMKDYETAVVLFERAMEIFERLIYHDGRRDLIEAHAALKEKRNIALLQLQEAENKKSHGVSQ
jgi:tetratricopeptide (TPR) repeat protein